MSPEEHQDPTTSGYWAESYVGTAEDAGLLAPGSTDDAVSTHVIEIDVAKEKTAKALHDRGLDVGPLALKVPKSPEA